MKNSNQPGFKMSIINDEFSTNRRSLDILNRYERARIIGVRSEEINRTGISKIKDKELIKNKSADEIAMMELNRNLIDYVIIRRMADGNYEFWDVRSLNKNY